MNSSIVIRCLSELRNASYTAACWLVRPEPIISVYCFECCSGSPVQHCCVNIVGANRKCAVLMHRMVCWDSVLTAAHWVHVDISLIQWCWYGSWFQDQYEYWHFAVAESCFRYVLCMWLATVEIWVRFCRQVAVTYWLPHVGMAVGVGLCWACRDVDVPLAG